MCLGTKKEKKKTIPKTRVLFIIFWTFMSSLQTKTDLVFF